MVTSFKARRNGHVGPTVLPCNQNNTARHQQNKAALQSARGNRRGARTQVRQSLHPTTQYIGATAPAVAMATTKDQPDAAGEPPAVFDAASSSILQALEASLAEIDRQIKADGDDRDENGGGAGGKGAAADPMSWDEADEKDFTVTAPGSYGNDQDDDGYDSDSSSYVDDTENDPDSGELELAAMMDSLVAELQMEMDLLEERSPRRNSKPNDMKLSAKFEKLDGSDGEQQEADEFDDDGDQEINVALPNVSEFDEPEPTFDHLDAPQRSDPDYVSVADYYSASADKKKDGVDSSRRSSLLRRLLYQQSSGRDSAGAAKRTLLQYFSNYLSTSSPSPPPREQEADDRQQQECGSAAQTLEEELERDAAQIAAAAAANRDMRYQAVPPDLELCSGSETFEKLELEGVSSNDPDYVPVRDYTTTPQKQEIKVHTGETSGIRKKRRGKRAKDNSMQAGNDGSPSSIPQLSSSSSMSSLRASGSNQKKKGRRTNKHYKLGNSGSNRKRLEKLLLDSAMEDGSRNRNANDDDDEGGASRDEAIRALAESDLWKMVVGAIGVKT